MRRIALATLAALLLAACGDDGSASDDAGSVSDDGGSASDELDAYADALAESFAVDEISEDFAFTDEDADCVASRAADVIGLERFEEVGEPADIPEATEEDLSVFELEQGELDKISAAFLDCVEDAEQRLREEFLSSAQVEGEQAECVADLVDRDLLIRILSTGIGGQDPSTALADIQQEFETCV